MFTSMVMSFRESFEIYLFILPLIIYLYKISKPNLAKNVYLGLAAGFLICVAAGFGLTVYFESLTGTAVDFVEASLKLFLSGLILYTFFVFQRINKNYDFININDKISITGINLFVVALITVFREGLEVIMYTLPELIKNPFTTVLGMFIGVVFSTILMLLIFKTTFKININIIFSICTLFLIFIGSECFAEALIYFLPSIELTTTAGQLIYSIPLLYIFIKSQLKKYIKSKR